MNTSPHPKFPCYAATSRIQNRIDSDAYNAKVRQNDLNEILLYIARLEAALNRSRTLLTNLTATAPEVLKEEHSNTLTVINDLLPQEAKDGNV